MPNTQHPTLYSEMRTEAKGQAVLALVFRRAMTVPKRCWTEMRLVYAHVSSKDFGYGMSTDARFGYGDTEWRTPTIQATGVSPAT